MKLRDALLLGFVGALLLTSAPVGATGEMAAVGIEKALKSPNLGQAVSMASQLYESNKEDIHESLGASVRVARAFVDFAGQPTVLRYQSIPEECVAAAMECLEAAEKHLAVQADDAARMQMARTYHDAAQILYKQGVGDKGDIAEKAALDHVTALTAGEPVPRGAFLLLGEISLAMCKADPRKARDRITAARAAFDKARELEGDSASLVRCSAETTIRLAETIELENEGKDLDAKVKKELCGLYEEALGTYQQGLKLAKDDADMKTGYNECVWKVMAFNKGKCKARPLFQELVSRYRKLKVRVPDSKNWIVKPTEELSDEDDVLELIKVDRKAGQSFVLWVSRYKWDYNYVNEETGESVGGDNIKGLAKRSYKWVRENYEDISNEKPLNKAALSRRISKAYMYRLEGRSKQNNLFEIRAYFFKHSKAQKTYRITVVADMGMLADSPYELEQVLDSFEMIEK